MHFSFIVEQRLMFFFFHFIALMCTLLFFWNEACMHPNWSWYSCKWLVSCSDSCASLTQWYLYMQLIWMRTEFESVEEAAVVVVVVEAKIVTVAEICMLYSITWIFAQLESWQEADWCTHWVVSNMSGCRVILYCGWPYQKFCKFIVKV